MTQPEKLSYRERQLMDILYTIREGTAAEVMERMDDPPGFSTVRKWLFIMESKNLLTHRKCGRKYIYTPVTTKEHALKRALDRIANVFFEGSKARAAATFLRETENDLAPDELEEIQKIIAGQRHEK